MNEKNMTKIMEFNQVEQTIEILGHKIDKSYESWEAFLEEMKRLTLVQNNWNELKKWLIQLQKFKGINQQGFSWGVAQEVLEKMQELEGNNE